MTEEIVELDLSDFRAKKKRIIEQQVGKIAPIVRSWFLSTAFAYMNSNKLKNQEEDFLEKFTDFYLDELKRMEEKCLRKV